MQNKHLIAVCNRNFHLQVQNMEVSIIEFSILPVGMVMRAVERTMSHFLASPLPYADKNGWHDEQLW